MILIRYKDNEYYIAKPISNIDVGSYVFVSGYETFGELLGYANTEHNLIKIKGSSTYLSVSQNKLYEIVGSTKSGFKYSLNRKDLDFQFGAFTPKEVIQYYLNYCEKNENATIDDFNIFFLNKNRNVITIEEINLESNSELVFGDVKPMLY
jgi:hypothetical protein